MTLQTDQVVLTLNNLIEICRDSEKGFQKAAERIADPHLRILFTDYQRQRGQLAEELQFEVRRLGAQPVESGSLAGKLHQGWFELKEAVTGYDDTDILAECERGEDVALEHYRDASQAELPEAVGQIVRRQCAAVQAAHDRIRDLEKEHIRSRSDHAAT